MKINKIKNRIFAFILCITVCMSLVPQYVWADDSVSDTVMIEETSEAQEQIEITDDTVSTEDTQVSEETTAAEEPLLADDTTAAEENTAAEETAAAEEPTTAEGTTAVEETAPAEEPTAAEVTAAAETENTSQQAVQPQTGASETPAVSGVANNLSKTVRTSDNYRYKITVSYDATAGIPADAKLSVKEITEKTIGINEDDIKDYIDQSAEALKLSLEEMSSVRLFDISLIGTDGTEYQPDEKVAVSIELLGKDNETEDMRVVHFGDKPEELTAEVESNTVTFETEGFSLFSLVDVTVLERVIDAALGDNKLYENDDIILTGKMPLHGSIEVTPVTVQIDGEDILASYDIKIYANPVFKALGITWQPTDGAIQVKVKSEVLDGAESVTVFHMTDENSEPEFVADADVVNSSVSFEAGSFSIYTLVKTILTETVEASDGSTYKITVTFREDAELPEGVSLSVKELSGEEYADYVGRASVAMEAAGFNYARVFDISIVDPEGKEVQPNSEVSVSVSLLDADNTEEEFSVVHFAAADDIEEPELIQANTEGNEVSFRTDGFSAYAIVQGPEPTPSFWNKITSIEELISMGGTTGLYIGHPDGYYYGNDTVKTTSNGTVRTGISKTKPAQSYPPADKASKYYFEQVEGSENQVYAYCYDKNGNKQYVYNGGNNSLSFAISDNIKTAFTVTQNSNGTFKLNNGAWYWNMQGGAGGNRFCSYNTANDVNNNVNFWYHVDITSDPYGFDGLSYGLMNWTGTPMGRAMMAGSSTSGALDAKSLIVMSTIGYTSHLFVPNDSDISMWTFKWLEDDLYNITASVEGITRYLKIDSNRISLTDTPDDSCKIQVVPGSGINAGQICFKSGDTALTYSGKIDTGFSVGGSTGSEWLYLVEESELTEDYFMTHSSSKVSVSDTSVTNGSRVIVYTRKWNDTTKKYEFYAIDSDGSLVRCYENGDTIQWVGGLLNTMLWNLVEYYWEDSDTPNYYYELFNQYSEKYIAPQETDGQILSDNTIGINLNGRKRGYFYSSIVAWDDSCYSYTGLKADLDAGKVVSCPLDEVDDFYFAIVQDLPADDTLTTVPTVDHTKYGIKMKMINLENGNNHDGYMSQFLGSFDSNTLLKPTQNILSTNLGSDNYPTVVNNGNVSLGGLYAGAQEVNNLFIASTYSGSGYYEFDSTQNFAALKSDGNFKVYHQLGTTDVKNSNSVKHGQFFPYNDIQAGRFASANRYNLYDAEQNRLPDTDPRKNEQLYLVTGSKPDYYYAVEIEASFTQTANGKDNWGHDIIYEFTGDDDFWLYVDGELIIDLGGIHSALPGSVNYSTGEVRVNGQGFTLRELFEKNYRVRNKNATASQVEAYLAQYFDEGSTIFKDFTTHTMRIFYMERGAGAANLHMRFNLASIRPGHVLLTKELDGIDAGEIVLAEFPYQIWYMKDGDANEYLLSQGNNPLDITVNYKDTTTPVAYKHSLTIDGNTYYNVFMLKPGEIADIAVPDDAISYKVVECGVNTQVYEGVTVKEDDQVIPVTRTGNRTDYSLGYIKTSERPRVTFVNKVNPAALRNLEITKTLYKEDGETPITNDPTQFTFRLYLATEFAEIDNDAVADMKSYHVKDSNGNYCRWDSASQQFISFGSTDYSSLTKAQKTQATFYTSMNGSISRIPAGYTVEFRNVLAGTKFKVVERPWEIPDGYSFQKYVLNGYESADPAEAGIAYVISANENSYVNVCNLRGWGMRVNKVWSDADYMTDRDATYFAVFTKDSYLNIVPSGAVVKDEYGADTTIVRQLVYGRSSIYWYFPNLPVAGTSLNDYVIREVALTDPMIDENGNVISYGSLTVLNGGDTITLKGKQKGETIPHDFTYSVVYDPGTVADGSQVRVDTVGNNRPGVLLKKTDWAGNPLQGATFVLKNSSDEEIGTFTSDENGVITTAFLSNDGAEYTLTETKAPQGYQGLLAPVKISQNNGQVSVSGPDISYYILDQGAGKETSLTIKNRPYTFTAIKVDANSSQPINGITFALHKQVTVGDVTSFRPMTGYDELVTGYDVEDGVIPKLDNTLTAGTYELREIAALGGYQLLSGYIHFTISATGEITLLDHPEGIDLTSVISTSGSIDYMMTIRNKANASLKITKNVTGSMGDRSAANQFTFTLDSVDGETSGTTYVWTKTAADGKKTTGSLTTAQGSNTFTLAHSESIEIELPLNKNVKITEDHGQYMPKWSTEDTDAVTMENADTATVTVKLANDAAVTITNDLPAVAPTGINNDKMPYGWILILGGLLAILAFPIYKRRKRDDNDPDGGSSPADNE